MRQLIGQIAGRFVLRVIIVSILFVGCGRPPPEPASTDFPIWGGVVGHFFKHAGLSPELNEVLEWEIVRWQVSSWVIDSIGWLEFKDSLLTHLTPPDVKILLQLRWNTPNLNPAPISPLQHCVPESWAQWSWFCYQMAELFKNDNVWFQLGNEPDMPGHKYWSGTIPEFCTYVNVGADAIKDANPDAYVVCGGFTAGRAISRTIRQIVDGLESDKIDALDRHFYKVDSIMMELGEEGFNEIMTVWPDYCHDRGYDCFITELSPPWFAKAKEAGVDCAMLFRLRPGKGVTHWAAEGEVATRLGRSVGVWIRGQNQIEENLD